MEDTDSTLSFSIANDKRLTLDALLVDRVSGTADYQYDMMNGEFYIQSKFSGSCDKVAVPEPRPKRF